MTHNQKVLAEMEARSLVKFMDPLKTNYVIERLTSFCRSRGLIKDFPQHRQLCLSACEQPNNIMSYNHHGNIWPLPQTGQMWLEFMLLANPDTKGFFCETSSYRDEMDPEVGRHDYQFLMFEVEIPGDFEALRRFQTESLDYLGFSKFKKDGKYPTMTYAETLDYFGLPKGTEITSEHEEKLIYHEFGPVFFLERFFNYTSPFWNMLRDGDLAVKRDIIIAGMETRGSAQRSCNSEEMWNEFHTISGGRYAKKMFKDFGKERVLTELRDFLSLEFFPRSGEGIGINRLICGMEKCDIMPSREELLDMYGAKVSHSCCGCSGE